MYDAMISGINNIGQTAMQVGKQQSELKLTAAKLKESEQGQIINDQVIAKNKETTAQAMARKQLIGSVEDRGAIAPKAMQGTPTATGTAVDFQDVKKSRQYDIDAKFYNENSQGLANFTPVSGEQLRKDFEARTLKGAQADQADVLTDERATETHQSKMANDKAAREAGRYAPISLDGGGIGRFNTKSGTVEDTGAMAPPKPVPKATDPDAGLPLDVKEQIKGLSTKNAGKIAIANQMESYLEQFKAAKTEDDKARIGGMMLKVLNSPEGADAIGVEESRRLGDALEYNVFDIKAGLGMKAGNVHGRDLPGFETQVEGVIKAVRGGTDRNKAEVDKLYGRPTGGTPGGGSSKFKILSVED